MSSTRVVTGIDERGRPKAEWRSTPGADEPRFGFMEPAHAAPIERRQATPEELAAARSREDEPTHLVAPTIAKPALQPPTTASAIAHASRMRGGAVTADLTRKTPCTAVSYRPKLAPQPEESAMSEAVPYATGGNEGGLATAEYIAVADAARELAYADAAVVAATERLDNARGRLREALAVVGLEASTVVDPVSPSIGGGPVDRRPKPARHVPPGSEGARRADVDKRGKLVLESLERHGGDTKAAGAELGMRGNIVALIAKKSRARQAVPK